MTRPRPETTPRVRYEPCPFDTNGDGDCGRRACPFCGKFRAKDPPGEMDRAIREALVRQALTDHERAVTALIAERDSLNRALGEAREEIDSLTEQRDSWERWGYGWKKAAEEAQRTTTTTVPILVKIPDPKEARPGVRCGRCSRPFWTVRGYRRHFVFDHLMTEGKK